LRIGASSCLLGEEVRFDGGHKRNAFLVEILGPHVEWHPVCPEVEAGMGTPRESIRLQGRAEQPQLVGSQSGTDYTPEMKTWVEVRLEEIAKWNLHGFVLKKNSPSCGLFRLPVYDDSGRAGHSGRGVFARALTGRFPLMAVEEEERLDDLKLRENFVERLFADERWQRMLTDEPNPNGLVRFHSAHKMTLLSHSPEHYRQLGRIVARAGTDEWATLTTEYSRGMSEAMQRPVTRRRHTNVLEHLAGYLKDHLTGEERFELAEIFEDYRRGIQSLIAPITLLNNHFRRHPVPHWVHKQVYLNSSPKELMLRNHV